MVANGQLNMFESDTSTPVLPLPEHVNYGLQGRCCAVRKLTRNAPYPQTR